MALGNEPVIGTVPSVPAPATPTPDPVDTNSASPPAALGKEIPIEKQKPGAEAPKSSLISSFLLGAKKVTLGLSPEEDEYAKLNQQQGPGQAIAQRAGEGAAFGSPFGPIGTLGGGIGSGVEEAMNIAYPGHTVINPLVGIISGAALGSIPIKAAQLGVKTGRSLFEMAGIGRSPVNDLYQDIGNTARLAGANGGSQFWMQGQGALREGIGGSERIVQNEQKLFDAIGQRANQLADELGPNLTQQELGEMVQANAAARAAQIGRETEDMYIALNNIVPKATNILPRDTVLAYQNLLNKYGGAPTIATQFQQPGVRNQFAAIMTDLMNSPQGLSYQVLQNMRTDIGEMISKGALNPNINIKEMRQVYAALTRDMEAAYTNLRALDTFRTVNSLAERNFDILEQTIQPLTKMGLEPELVTQRLLAQAKKGGTRIDDITSQLNNVDPDTRNTVMGYVLRRMGETTERSFDPQTFYRNWQQLSPEAKDLFPAGQRAGIDRLGQLSGLTADSLAYVNRSHTTGTHEFLNKIQSAVNGLTSIATGGLLGSGAHVMAGGNMEADIAAGLTGAWLGHKVISPMTEAMANNMLARLWTSKAFNTWLGTQAPNMPANKSLAMLGAVAAEEPELKSTIDYLLNYIGGSNTSGQLQPGEVGRGFAEGGLAELFGMPSAMTQIADNSNKIQDLLSQGKIKEAAHTGLDDPMLGAFGTRDIGRYYRANLAGPHETKESILDHFRTREEMARNRENENFDNKTWYHGSSKGFDQIDPYQSNYGLYGMGAYLTDDASVASSYSKKGAKPNREDYGPSVHAVNLDKRIEPMDMEAPAILHEWAETPVFKEYGDLGELQSLHKNPTNRDVFKYLEDNYIGSEIQPDQWHIGEMMQDSLKDMGYNAITHKGGQIRGSKEHRVMIVFDPEHIESAISGFNDGGVVRAKGDFYNPQLPRVKSFAEGGAVNSRIDTVAKELTTLGISPEAARGAAKYMYINESKLDPNIVNPISGAHGLGQWLGSRKQELFGTYGSNPSFEQQVQFIKKELQTSEKSVLAALLKAGNNEKMGYDIWGRLFERPGEAALAKAGVNYNPGNVKESTLMASSKGSSQGVPGNSLIGQFMAEKEQEDNPLMAEDEHEHLRNALVEGAEPATKEAIYSILGKPRNNEDLNNATIRS